MNRDRAVAVLQTLLARSAREEGDGRLAENARARYRDEVAALEVAVRALEAPPGGPSDGDFERSIREPRPSGVDPYAHLMAIHAWTITEARRARAALALERGVQKAGRGVEEMLHGQAQQLEKHEGRQDGIGDPGQHAETNHPVQLPPR